METRHDAASMSMDSTDSMSSMSAVFMNSASTPLYSSMWAPSTVGQYAGTCIFLIVLAAVFRGLFAAKHMLEERWLATALQRRYVVVADKTPAAERIERDDSSRSGVLTANGVEERVMVAHRPTHGAQPWRFSVDLPRAAMVTVIVGVGYLLMLAVMTMNVGYFLSVLGGTFLGEMVFGRYARSMSDHH